MWYHWSIKKISIVEKEYVQNGFKPNGLWMSYNDEWKEWCEETGFQDLDYFVKNEFFVDMKNVINIDTIETLREFCKKYKFQYEQGINWEKVSREYDGINFSNYKNIKKDFMKDKYLIRNHTWYLGIDINSCCIFNIKCLTDF